MGDQEGLLGSARGDRQVENGQPGCYGRVDNLRVELNGVAAADNPNYAYCMLSNGA